ncbi:MAG: trans-sulfuration enzyme family protein [Thermodesulfobacteriota bacterium]
MSRYKSILTKAVHAGERRLKPDFHPVSTPIYQTVGYIYEKMEDLDAIFANRREGFVYTRYANPTNAALEEALTSLEEGQGALTFASGMAAVYASLLAAGVKTGTDVVAAYDIYGATYAICSRLLPDMGVRVKFVDISNLAELSKVLTETKPVAIILETISNPLMKVADVPTISKIAQRTGTKLIVDNTFATPVLFRPLTNGADFCVHSTTKYIGGHGDVLGGAVVTTKENRAVLHEILKMTGGNLGPTEAWLTLRGLKTLPLRMRQHCQNAWAVAKWLEKHPRVEKVYYPGLSSHPQHELAEKIFSPGMYGGMVSFEIKDAQRADIFLFMEKFKLILPATTLGDVYSLVLYPPMSSHRALSSEEREKVGISDRLVRLSVGIEEVNEIIEDLNEALK